MRRCACSPLDWSLSWVARAEAQKKLKKLKAKAKAQAKKAGEFGPVIRGLVTSRASESP